MNKLTVTDLGKSTVFYQKLPGFKIAAEYPHFVMFSCGNFKLGLTDHKNKLSTSRFSEFNVGLDHLSFLLGSEKDLNEAKNWLREQKIQHSEVEQLSNGTKILVFRDPDNIQLEFTYKS